ncbi:MAG: hypothetical protein ACRCVV_02435, partial [Shewanella sp.]
MSTPVPTEFDVVILETGYTSRLIGEYPFIQKSRVLPFEDRWNANKYQSVDGIKYCDSDGDSEEDSESCSESCSDDQLQDNSRDNSHDKFDSESGNKPGSESDDHPKGEFKEKSKDVFEHKPNDCSGSNSGVNSDVGSAPTCSQLSTDKAAVDYAAVFMEDTNTDADASNDGSEDGSESDLEDGNLMSDKGIRPVFIIDALWGKGFYTLDLDWVKE